MEQQRADILDYQAKLDDARERVDAGDMTRDEFERVRAGLEADMPEVVRNQIAELADQPKVDAKSDISQAALKLDISDDMVPKSRSASVPTFNLGS